MASMRGDPLPVLPTQTAAIAILTWRGYDVTHACLDGLRSLAGWPAPTVVVDNDSGTGEGERLAREFGHPVEAVTRNINDGVPGGYNAGLSWAAGRGVSHVLLLNNDVRIVDPAMLKHLLEAAGPDVAAVGPIVRDRDGSIFSAGGQLDMRRGRWDHRKRPLRSEAPYEVEWLDGPALLVSIDAARAIGGLAPEYFMYAEELDWCVRARRAGYRCVVQPATSIIHERSTLTPSSAVRYLMFRNSTLFMRRNGTPLEILGALAWQLFWRAPGLVVRSRRDGTGVLTAFRIILRSLSWNLGDAARRRSWRVRATGPSID